MDAALIARYFPGFGNPWELNLREWNGALDRLVDIVELENPGDTQHQVQAKLKQIHRNKRRLKTRHSGNGTG